MKKLKRLAILGAILALIFGGFDLFAGAREQSAAQAWATATESMEALTARYPKTPTNAAGLALEARARALGIRLAPREVGPDRQPAEAERKTLEAVQPALAAFVTAQQPRADDRLAELPAEVAQFLSAHAAEIAALAATVVAGPPLAWETDMGRLLSAPPRPGSFRLPC